MIVNEMILSKEHLETEYFKVTINNDALFIISDSTEMLLRHKCILRMQEEADQGTATVFRI